ncbi:MAG: C69 family dipeptidase [Desulfurococcales archaeon]
MGNKKLFLTLGTSIALLIVLISFVFAMTPSSYQIQNEQTSAQLQTPESAVQSFGSQAIGSLGTTSINSTSENESDQECFAILVGKNASADGSVIVAHNEDDSGKLVDLLVVNPANTPFGVNGYLATKLTNGTWVYRELDTSLVVPVPNTTYAFWGAIMPGVPFSGRYVNQYGVLILSNSASASREDNPQLVNGGIRELLRLLVIQQAKTAREAVQLIGYYVETYGYGAPARNYIVADPNEIWVVEVVYGKHWVAERVPDDSVVAIPNYFVVHEVNLSDTQNFMGSSDLIQYAIQRGWYDPSRDGAFDFAKAYGTPANQASTYNIYRHQTGLYFITGSIYPTSDLPFAVHPKSKLSPQDCMNILKQVNHVSIDNVKYASSLPGSFHQNLPIRAISPWHNQDSWVAELRSWLPPEIGVVVWRAPGIADENLYMPIYLGIIYSKFPAPYTFADPNKIDLSSAYWTFRLYSNLVDLNYLKLNSTVNSYVASKQSELFKMQPYVEDEALKIYNELGPSYAGKYLASYSNGVLMNVYTDILEMVRTWQNNG